MVIDKAQSEDLRRVLAVLKECGLPAGSLGADDMQRFLVARSGRCVVGAAGMVNLGSVAVGHSLGVVPGFRGMGLGRQLAVGLLDWSASQGLSSIYLFTCQAEFYFRAMGFTVIATEEVPLEVKDTLSGLCDPDVVSAGHVLHYPIVAQSLAAGAESLAYSAPW